MFNIARYVVRHKVGAVAVIALGVVFFAPDRDDQDLQEAANPWSANAASVQVAQVQEAGFVDGIVGGAVDYLDKTGMNPVAAAEESTDRFGETASALDRANR